MFIAGCILFGIGLIMIIIGIACTLGGNLTWKYDGKTTGRIIDMCLNAFDYNNGNSGKVGIGIISGGGGNATRRPVYEYCVNGITYNRASSVGWNIGKIQKKIEQATPICVYYKLDNPAQSTITKSSVLKIVGISLSGCAALLLLLGIIFLLIGIM